VVLAACDPEVPAGAVAELVAEPVAAVPEVADPDAAVAEPEAPELAETEEMWSVVAPMERDALKTGSETYRSRTSCSEAHLRLPDLRPSIATGCMMRRQTGTLAMCKHTANQYCRANMAKL